MMDGAFLTLDLMPLAAAVLSSTACGLLGSLLVLRRESLLGDAISHAVLPGIVVAFLIGSSGASVAGGLFGDDPRNPLLMLIGAGVAGVSSVVLIEVVKRVGRVEPGAAMGVVFSIFFAAGVYLMQQAARNVDLDASCVLYGDLEGLIWVHDGDPLSPESLARVPRQVVTLAAVLALGAAFTTLFFKELRISSFDPGLASSLGFRSGWLATALLVLVALATVASFEAVGSILVIAMLICPGATARLFTDRLRTHVVLSVAIAALTALLGYVAGAHLLGWLGRPGALNIAGSISVVAGLLFAGAAVLSPSHGVAAKLLHRRALARRVALEDLLGSLYRLRESGMVHAAPTDLHRDAAARERLLGAAPDAVRAGLVERRSGSIGLTSKGTAIAAELVRRHRLWETYLVERAGLSPDHVHDPAEQLEHLLALDDDAWARLPHQTDPHGRQIPDRDPGAQPPSENR